MKERGELVVATALMLGLASAASAASTPITTCGGTIAAGQRGVLQNDVTCDYRCSGDPSIVCGYGGDHLCNGTTQGSCKAESFTLEPGATLDLNGHTIHMAYHAAGARCGASADDTGRCVVRGPGTFHGGKGTAIEGGRTHVVVRNVSIENCDDAIKTGGRVVLDGISVSPDRENTVSSGGALTIRNSTIDGGYGMYARGDVRLENVVLGPKAAGVTTESTLRARDVTLHAGTGLGGRNIVARRVTSVPDPLGIEDGASLAAERNLRMVDSDVDFLFSGLQPVLVRSTCALSFLYDGSSSWGVCTDD